MSSLYRLAMREQPPLVIVNPFADLELPRIEPRPVQFYERDEAAALYEAAGEWRTLVELGMDVGLRPGELYGLHGHRVDWLRGKLAVIDVMTRQGLRQHPKSKRSHRVVPVPPATLEAMSVLIAGRPRDSLVFTAPEGGPVTDGHFRDRVWYPAVAAAGVRRFPPPVMRRTTGLPGSCGRASAVRRPGPARPRRITRQRSGTRTLRPTRTARSWSPGRGV